MVTHLKNKEIRENSGKYEIVLANIFKNVLISRILFPYFVKE